MSAAQLKIVSRNRRILYRSGIDWFERKGGVFRAALLDKGFYRCWSARSGQYKINMCDGQQRFFSRGHQHLPVLGQHLPGSCLTVKRGARVCWRVIDFFDSSRTKGTLYMLGPLAEGMQPRSQDLPTPGSLDISAPDKPLQLGIFPPRMTNNKHRRFSLSNGVFTDKKFTWLPSFVREPCRLAFSRTPAGSQPPSPTTYRTPPITHPIFGGCLDSDTSGLFPYLVRSALLPTQSSAELDFLPRLSHSVWIYAYLCREI